MEAVLRGGRSSREGELCVQAVFSLLDTLRLWLEDTRPALLANPGSSTSAPAAASGTQASQAFVAVVEPARRNTWSSATDNILLTLHSVGVDSGQTDGTAMTYEAAVAAIPTVKHVQDLVDSIPQVRRPPACYE